MPGGVQHVATFNGPTAPTYCALNKAIVSDQVKWGAYQTEIGAGGNPHIQLAIVFKSRKTSTQVMSFLQGISDGCTCIRHMASVVIDLTGDSGDETEEMEEDPPTTGGGYESQLRVVIPGQ